MIIVLEENTGTLELAEQVIVVYEVTDFNIPSGINESIFTEEGQIILSLAANTPTALNNPNADGLVVTSNPSVPGKAEWRAVPSGGGGGNLTNKRGTAVETGHILIVNSDVDNSFRTSAIDTDFRVLGVAAEAISNNADGRVLSNGRGTALVQGNVRRGAWLVNSTTDGRARDAGFIKPAYGGVGIALEAYSGGGAGSVSAWIKTETYWGYGRERGYQLGGLVTSAIAIAQAIDFSSETTAVIAAAALSTARYTAAGVSGQTTGFAMGGNTTSVDSTTDRVTYATEITAVVAGAALSTARSAAAGVSGQTTGFVMGGYTTSAVSTTDRVTYATEVTAVVAGASLSTARRGGAGVSGQTTGFAMGGATTVSVSTTDRVTYATEVTAVVAGAALSAARNIATGVSGQTTGFAMGGFTTVSVSTTDRVTYATEVTAVVAGAALSAARYGTGGASGVNKGFALGGYTTIAVTTTDRVTYATEVTVTVSSANLQTAAYYVAGISASI